MEKKYPLYYTLNTNIPKTKMTKAQDFELKKKLDVANGDSKKAVIMLIAEHSRVTENSTFDDVDIVLPYSGVQDDDDVIFDLKDIPHPLKWILWKFVNLNTPVKDK